MGRGKMSLIEETHNDKDPEDAWDSGDLVDSKVRILHQIVDGLQADPDPARRQSRANDARRLLGILEEALDRLVDEVVRLRQRLGG